MTKRGAFGGAALVRDVGANAGSPTSRWSPPWSFFDLFPSFSLVILLQFLLLLVILYFDLLVSSELSVRRLFDMPNVACKRFVEYFEFIFEVYSRVGVCRFCTVF